MPNDPEYKDYPLLDVCETADQLIEQGMHIHQKFTCAGCGQRLTIEEPNKFYTKGTCDKCSTVTDIKKQGCNYLVITRGE